MTTTEKIIQYLDENDELFVSLIEELDSWNGYLADDRYYPMWELSDLLHGTDIVDAIRMAVYGNFNPNDDYFRFNGYGNLESSDCIDYSDYLDDYFVRDLVKNRGHLTIDDDELNEMLDELEEE